ncbi:MAG: hypothetical protein B6I20_13000 [Bacteroidetes bacterium 4572_117]|nr:MAG: hypothetical protein B6I20_13000 [Bacteroidetes bacterium 4572_117]
MNKLSTKPDKILTARKKRNSLMVFFIFVAFFIIFPPTKINACSVFFLRNNNHMVVGRNLDFSYSDYMISVNKRNATKIAMQYEGEIVELPAVWTSKYGSIASNMFAREIPADGMNEAGLVISVAILEQTVYSIIPNQPSIVVDQWVQYMLDNFATVEEVIESCSQINIRYNPGDYWRVHIMVSDGNGTSAIIEFLNGELHAYTGEALEIKAMTNTTYESSIEYYRGGVMSGASLSSVNRYFKTAEMLDNYNNEDPVTYAYQIMDYVAQRHTQRRMVYDISNRKVYLWSLKNNNVRYFDFSSFDFSCDEPVMIYKEDLTDDGDITDKFIVHTTQINRDFIEIGWQYLHKSYTEEELTNFSLYPESFECVLAQLIYWTGVENNDWNNSNNWAPATLPNEMDTVCIQTGQINYPENNSGIDIDIASMTIEEGAHIVIPPGTNLRVQADITLRSSSLGDAHLVDDDNLSVEGNTVVERYLKGGQFHYISSPLNICPHTIYSKLPQGGNNPNFYAFDEESNSENLLEGWSNSIAVSGNLIQGKGYANYLHYDNVYKLTGGVLNTGDISIDISNSNHEVQSDGWNLVGNPYPSGIAADIFIYANSSVIDGTLYFWDDDESNGSNYNTDDYACWNLAGAIGTGSGSASGSGVAVPNGTIASGQAFFVKKSDPGTEALIFQNNMRTIETAPFFKTDNQKSFLRFSLANKPSKLYNEILLAFINEGDDGFNKLFDAVKLRGNKNIAFYSLLDDYELAIQSFGKDIGSGFQEKIIPLGYTVSESANYTISFIQKENIPENAKVCLEDTKLNKFIDINKGDEYSFDTEPGTFNDRFKIFINKNTNTGITKKEYSGDSMKIYNYGKTLYLNFDKDDIGGDLSIFDILGNTIDHFKIKQTKYAITVDNLKGIIVIRVESNGHFISKHVMIN